MCIVSKIFYTYVKSFDQWNLIMKVEPETKTGQMARKAPYDAWGRTKLFISHPLYYYL
jgi:hypothetical protein